jgi:hypothetical protein
MKDIYHILLDIRTSKIPPILHPERLETAKNSIETRTDLRPTNLQLIWGIWKLPIYPRLRDLLWNSLIGRLKIGKYWQNMPGYEERAHCQACIIQTDSQTLENERHLWTECKNNGQEECWRTAKNIWQRYTHTTWPDVDMGTIWGIGTFRFPNRQESTQHTIDSERFGIMTSLVVWAIWKVRNEHAINPERMTNTDSASGIFKDALKDIIKKSWTSIDFEPESKCQRRTARITVPWGNTSIAGLERGKPPVFSF